MTVTECHDLINKHYPDPIRQIYTPSKYDVQRAITPKRIEKLNALIAKEQAKLDAVTQKLSDKKAAVHRTIDDLATYPDTVASLFLSTFKWTIEDLIRRHEAFLAKKQMMVEAYSEEVMKRTESVKYFGYEKKWESTWSGRGRRVEVRRDITPEMWSEFAAHNGGYWDNAENKYVYPFTTISDYVKFLDDYDEYKTLRENDDVVSCDGDAYVNAINHMADTLERIACDITAIFNGSKPTLCETDARWGVDGHFNGILSDGKTRASFKSFGAGGWNIQCFHYRFKITKLVSKKAC